jgi:hypothetical protein
MDFYLWVTTGMLRLRSAAVRALLAAEPRPEAPGARVAARATQTGPRA